MLYTLSLITAVLLIVTGLYVLFHGTWHKLGLKFAGVALSTIAGIWLLVADFLFGTGVFACPTTMPAAACMSVQFYFVIRNVAFIIFHIAVGRDAIIFKHRERRGTACQMNSQKPSPL